MNTEITRILEQYLAGELSAEDKQLFEERLANSAQLREEVELMQYIQAAAKRSALRAEIGKVSTQYHWMRNLKWGGTALGILAVIAASTWFAVSKLSEKDIVALSELKDLTAKLESSAPIDNLNSEFFSWNGTDTAMLSKDGVLISIPEGALLLNGKPYTDQAIIQWQEALDGTSIVKAGLSTTSDGKLLETQGMFSFSATTTDGKQLSINPKTGIYVQVPVDEYKEGMMLFDGVKDKDGMVNWVKPRKLEKLPVPVPMDQLDFYPPGYEDKLNELKARKDKKYRDSLYLSFEETIGSQNNVQEEKWTGKQLFDRRCSACHMIDKNSTGPKLRGVRAKWDKGGAKNGSIYSWVKDWQKTASSDPYAKEITRWSQVAHADNPDLTNNQIDMIFDYVDGNNTAPTNQATEKRSGGWQDKISWSFYVEYLPGGEANIVGKAKLKSGWYIFSVDHDPSKADFLGIPTTFILPSVYDVQPVDQLQDGHPFTRTDQNGTIVYFQNEATFKQRVKVLNNARFPFSFRYAFQICNQDGCIYPPDQTATVWFNSDGVDEAATESSYIPPSAVLGFWNKKFDNTILATREFEKRMRSVHGTCKKQVLDVYVNNLDRPLHELDRKVAEMGHGEFFTFEDEMVGVLNPNDPHIKGLKAFYEQAVRQLKSEERHNREKEKNRRNDWDNSVATERAKEVNRSAQRDAEVFVEEYNLNHKNVRKQLGRTLGARIYGTRPVSNIDKFVLETTLARKTAEFFDEETGKTARIQYNEFNFSVADQAKYDQLYAYLFPDKLNSYHRLKGENGKFSFPLNDAIIYDLAIVGINEEGYSYVQRLTLKGGEIGTLNLDKVSETALNTSIRQLNRKRGVGSLDVKEELDWLVKEQENYVELKKRRDELLFREKVRKVVFPCWNGLDATCVKADTLDTHIPL